MKKAQTISPATGGTASEECGSSNLTGSRADAGSAARENLRTGKASTNSYKGAKKVGGGAAVSAYNTAAPGPDVKAPPLTHAALDRSIPRGTKLQAAQLANEALIKFRSYQHGVYLDHETGLLILHWSRQIGKSYTLAAWAVDRVLSKLTKHQSWLVTVLSNSRDNGAEFALKCAEVCKSLQTVTFNEEDASPDLQYQNMRMEIRITMVVDGRERVGRIKVLAANPRTARGFSGDLILDEFAFHEDSNAIWEAAEPILSANPEFMCRIASTGNGTHNMFYRMAAGPGPNDGRTFESANGFTVSRVTRTEAWKMGVKVYDLKSKPRRSITPDEARAKSLDKRAYDQNYECQFNFENTCLLTHELISAAEREGITIDSQEWSPAAIARMFRAKADLFFGQDFGRTRDLSVLCVGTKDGAMHRIVAMLRMEGMRTPDQQRQLDVVCGMPRFVRGELDMTGNGLGLTEYAQEKWGFDKIGGVNFASTEPTSDRIKEEGRKQITARVTEIMATDMQGVFEDRAIEIPMDQELHDDLRKPEKIVSPGGRVSIAATRDEAGHADHFWGIALFIRAAMNVHPPGVLVAFKSARTERSVLG